MTSFTLTMDVNPEDHPDTIGEFLRETFFRKEYAKSQYLLKPYRKVGCYEVFDWAEGVEPLEKLPIPDDPGFYWNRGKKLIGGGSPMSAALKERLLDEFEAEGLIQSREILPKGRRYHCGSCSCYDCGRHEEDCVCSSNDILKIIEKVFSEGE